MDSNRILISGAGTAGLALAIALKQRGHKVLVLEKNNQHTESGTGITIWSNGIQGLIQLGFDADLKRILMPIDYLDLNNRHGQLLKRIPLDDCYDPEKIGATVVHRRELQKLLLSKMTDEEVILSCEVVGYEKSPRGVIAFASNGERYEGRLLVSCDGGQSQLRKSVDPNYQLNYCGHRIYRGVANIPEGLIPRGHSINFIGDNGYFLAHHLTNGRCYWLGSIGTSRPEEVSKKGLKDNLMKRFSSWSPKVRSVIDCNIDDEILVHNILKCNEVMYGDGESLLILGDAAHATAPQLGQGACLAIEDGIILAKLIDQNLDLESLTKKLTDLRKVRAINVIKGSQRVANIYHIKSKWIQKLRDISISITPSSVHKRRLKYAKAIDEIKVGGDL